MASVGIASRWVGTMADPAVRVTFTVQHRNDETLMAKTIGSRGCQYIDPLTGVTCDHAKGCACHMRSHSESEAGITDLFAHDFKTLSDNELQDIAEGVPTLQGVRYLHFVPGSADWLTSATPTPDQWYARHEV